MDSTRIADLPDNANNIQVSVIDTAGYTQMNVHPNPYGNKPPQQSMMPNPQQTQAPPKLNGKSFSFPAEQQLQQHPQQQPQQRPKQQEYAQPQYEQNHMMPQQVQRQEPQYPLPSRDIPMITEVYSRDENVRPNYIPPAKHTDYISPESDDEIVRKRAADKRVRFMDDVYISFQRPIILALVVFLLQMPIMNALLFRYLPFLHLYGADGNINMLGITFKSIVFGLVVYGFEAILSYLRY